jgi:hypothetical protein
MGKFWWEILSYYDFDPKFMLVGRWCHQLFMTPSSQNYGSLWKHLLTHMKQKSWRWEDVFGHWMANTGWLRFCKWWWARNVTPACPSFPPYLTCISPLRCLAVKYSPGSAVVIARLSSDWTIACSNPGLVSNYINLFHNQQLVRWCQYNMTSYLLWASVSVGVKQHLNVQQNPD